MMRFKVLFDVVKSAAARHQAYAVNTRLTSCVLQDHTQEAQHEEDQILHDMVRTAAALQVPFSVSGNAIAPSVQLSTTCLSFGSLPANETAVKLVHVTNSSELPVYFEFATDQMGVFGFDRVRGSIPAQSAAHVTVTFQPVEASNYWKRVTCLIRVSALHGSSFSERVSMIRKSKVGS